MREKLEVNGRVLDNISMDKKVGFIEDTHTYIMLDDLDFEFNSVTTLIKEFEYEEFIPEDVARRVTKEKKSQYYGRDYKEVMEEWVEASRMGTRLHEYGEKLLNGETVAEEDIPNSPKAKWVPILIQEIKSKGYELARTELLVYSEELRLAGQSDIILKRKRPGTNEYDYMIYDFKFLKDPLKKKSYYNPVSRRYKNMSGPFRYLQDCNWMHYSIQLAIYQTLTGDPSRIIEKVLVVVNESGYEFHPCYPMRVFWDENLELQAVYETWDGMYYDSRMDCKYKQKPTDIVGY